MLLDSKWQFADNVYNLLTRLIIDHDKSEDKS